MIIPNLKVRDMKTSLSFYHDALGMQVKMVISSQREMLENAEHHDIAFAVLEWNGSELMLQTEDSLSGDLPNISFEKSIAPTGTVYFRGWHPQTVIDRISKEQIIKGPELSWYGMMELYLCDPDGHIICLGAPEGDGPK